MEVNQEQFFKKVRVLLNYVQFGNRGKIDLYKLEEVLAQATQSDVLFINTKGHVNKYNREDNKYDKLGSMLQKKRNGYIKERFRQRFSSLNMTYISQINEGEENQVNYAAIPLIFAGSNFGTLMLVNQTGFCNYDLIIGEYSAMILAIELFWIEQDNKRKKLRKVKEAKLALQSLSYTEKKALEEIITNLDGREGIVVASEIAEKLEISRAAIVNTLRKMSGAGILESVSVGMKGTFVKILNKNVLDLLKLEEVESAL